MKENKNEILRYALDNGMIDMTYIQKEMNMKIQKEILEKHQYNIWFGKDGFWHTYLPAKNGKRKAIKKKNEDDLISVVVEYWSKQYGNTFKDRFEAWKDRQKLCGRSDNTIYKYEADYKRFISGDAFEKLDIREITEEEIASFLIRLLNSKEVTYKALKALFGYINGVFEKSIRDKRIETNPCKFVDLPVYKQKCVEPRKKTSKERTLSIQEKMALLSKIEKSSTIAKYAVELSLYTGMRVGELSALMWSDIDYEKEIITVSKSEKHNRKTKEYYISSTKNGKIRDIPLTEEMKQVLRRTKVEEAKMGFLSEYVFCDENGRVHASKISDFVRNNTMSKEFENIKSVHAIRRTLNSNMKCIGVSTTVAAAILGHTEKVNEENYTYDVSSMEEKRSYIQIAGKIS